jgi:hypothetical protein
VFVQASADNGDDDPDYAIEDYGADYDEGADAEDESNEAIRRRRYRESSLRSVSLSIETVSDLED